MCSSRRRNKLSSNSSRVILLKGGWVFVFLPKAPGESKERLFLYVMFLIHHISGCILSRGLESILSHVFKRKFMKYTKCALVHHLIILRHSFFFLNFIFIYFLSVSQGMWDLSSWPGIEPVLPAMEVRILNHLTAREVPILRHSCIWKIITFHSSMWFNLLSGKHILFLKVASRVFSLLDFYF